MRSQLTGEGASEKIKKEIESTNNLNLNAQDEFGDTALMHSLDMKQKEMAQYLLSHSSVNVNLLNHRQESALIFTIRNNPTDITKKILEKTSSETLHVQSFFYGTPLVASIYFRNYEIFSLLLGKEDFNDTVHPGALITAVRNNDVQMIRDLINKGSDVNSIGEAGFKEPPSWVLKENEPSPFAVYGPPVFDLPIIIAMQENKVNALEAILEAKPNLTKQGASLFSAKELFDAKEGLSEETKQLIENYIDNQQNENILTDKQISLSF